MGRRNTIARISFDHYYERTSTYVRARSERGATSIRRSIEYCFPRDRLKSAVERLVAVAHPRLIILFGSQARGDADVFSDVDLLVVEAAVPDRYEEMVRLSRSLRGLLLPVDLLVVSEQEFDRRSETPGTVEHAARHEGRVLYAA